MSRVIIRLPIIEQKFYNDIGGDIVGVKLVKSETRFAFKFEGESTVDAMLLSDTIKNFAELTKETLNSDEPEAYIKLNVTAFKSGSFIIDFSTVCEINNLLASMPQAVSLAKDVVETIKGFFEIKKFLKGENPGKIDRAGSNIRITNGSGNTLVVPKGSIKILENAKIETLTVNICDGAALKNDSGFSFITESGESIYTKEDIQEIRKPLPMRTEGETILKRTTITVSLPIKKPDILGKSVWEFKFQDHRITAIMEDEKWIDKVREGKVAFKSGDALYVHLEITVELDHEGNPIDGSEKYTVLKVLDHLTNVEQTNLE